jgi:hypothetical protein
VRADEVDQPPRHQRRDLPRVAEQLAQGDRGCADAADLGQPVGVLRRENVLEEEQTEGLEGLGELDRVDGGEALVHVVQQLDLLAKLPAEILEQGGDAPELLARVEVGPVGGAFGRLHGRRLDAGIATELAANVAESALEEASGGVGDGLGLASVGVAVDVGGGPALAAPQLVAGHARLLALDVPQGHVQPADGVVEHRPVAPVAADHRRLPEVLHVARVAPHGEGPQVAIEGLLDGPTALRERRAAQPVQARLARPHADDDQPRAHRLGQKRLDGFDPQLRHRTHPVPRRAAYT